MKKKRIKTNILITLFMFLIINFGLISKLNNDIISISYITILGTLLYNLGRRFKVI